MMKSNPVTNRAPAATQVTTEPGMLDQAPALSFGAVAILLGGAAAGAFAAIVLLPIWLPGIDSSLAGEKPQAYWFLSRAGALVAYILIWIAMALGLAITSKTARLWPGGPVAFDLHQHTSLLGLAFAVFHALILLGDNYIGYSIGQILTPFASAQYRPLWVGLGQIGLYGLAAIALSFYARQWIGPRGWRAIHFLSFVVFALALIHGVASGTDSAHPLVSVLYWTSGGSLLFLTVYRILVTTATRRPDRRQVPARAAPR